MKIEDKRMIDIGVKVAHSEISEEDRIWARYSKDKIDIGEELAKVIRTLNKEFPLSKKMRALSIGSSVEPQFRILDTAFLGGLYLLDIDKSAIEIVKERIHRQNTTHVNTITNDYNEIFLNSKNTDNFLKIKLSNKKVDLITLHHSLYYCEESKWHIIFENLYKKILAKKSAIHAVLMASDSNNHNSTTWIYNYFAGKFCGCHNDQDLQRFKKELELNRIFKEAQILVKTHNIHFFVNDFAKFMKVVWMILLYPEVHKYSIKQMEEIAEFIYKKLWLKNKPLIQTQDHMVIYKRIGIKGLI